MGREPMALVYRFYQFLELIRRLLLAKVSQRVADFYYQRALMTYHLLCSALMLRSITTPIADDAPRLSTIFGYAH